MGGSLLILDTWHGDVLCSYRESPLERKGRSICPKKGKADRSLKQGGKMSMVAVVGMLLCGIMSEPLAERIEGGEGGVLISVSVILEEQATTYDLLHVANGAPMPERRKLIINYLKRIRDRSQRDVLSLLNVLKEQGGVEHVRSLWLVNAVCFDGTPDAIRRVAGLPGILRMNLDEERELLPSMGSVPTVAGGRELVWNIAKVRAPEVWALGYTGSDIIIAVMDTGVRYSHVDLADHIWTNDGEIPNNGIDDDGNGYTDDYFGYDFYNEDGDPMDDHGHGTHCAGCIAGDGTAGCTTGVAPDARIMSCKTMSSGGSATESDGWEAMQYALDNGAHIITMTYGWMHSWNPDRAQWRNSCNAILAGGIIMSVLSGAEDNNYGPPENVRTPGDCPPPWLHPDQTLTGGVSGVITAGATDQSDIVASFSSRGPVSWETVDPWFDYDYQPGMGLIDPDISAPGINIKSLDNSSDSSYDISSGTSWATAHISGGLALVLSKNGTLLPAFLDSILEMTAVDLGAAGKDNDYGAGRLDCYEAVQYAPAGIAGHEKGLFFDAAPSIAISPNPFTAVTRVRVLGMSGNGVARIVVYDVSGRPVRHFWMETGDQDPGAEVVWDGRDDRGERLGVGVYFVKLGPGRCNAIAKVILVE